MVKLLRIVLQILPWLLVIGILTWMLIQEKITFKQVEGQKETYQRTLLSKVEQMGRLELVKYNFQEVTEIKKIADYVDLKIFKYKPLPDAKAVLISNGSATGCIDLTKLEIKDIAEQGDTLFVSLPSPELCHFKIDLEKSRIYDLQVNYLKEYEQKTFIQELYKLAEAEIRNTALETGILDQTRENAMTILKPLLENLSGKVVVLTFQLDEKIEPAR